MASQNVSSITGPQGHGFYTSGPWKIDTAHETALQFSKPQLIMVDYFTIMGTTGILEEVEESVMEPKFPVDQTMSNGNGYNDSMSNIDMSNSIMEDSQLNDSDMVMIGFM